MVIQRELVAYRHQESTKAAPRSNLEIMETLTPKIIQANKCATCNTEMIWAHMLKDKQQLRIDWHNNAPGHMKGNVLHALSAKNS